jgi:ribosomal protein L32
VGAQARVTLCRVTDCPNCGADVPEGVRLCPNCGFDTGEAQADEVRALREAGRIHPGRLGAEDPEDFAGPAAGDDPPETPPDEGLIDPRDTEGGL